MVCTTFHPPCTSALPQRRFLSGLGLALLLLASCQSPEAPASAEPESAAVAEPLDSQVLIDLLAGLRVGNLTFPAPIEALLSGQQAVAQDDPNWPTLAYLLGEVKRQRGETERARITFRDLASWAVSNHPRGPYNDTWGGSGLAVLGLWRWLQILDQYGPTESDEVDRVLETASQLQETRLYSGMVRTGLLGALPLLEEDVARRLAHVAWKNRRPEATSLFLDFLTIDSSGEMDPIDEEIQAEIMRRELVDPERLELFRARRMLGLVKTREQKERAADILKRLWENRQNAADVRAEAGYEWAHYNRRQRDRQELLTILTEVLVLVGDGEFAEKALYRRGLVHNRGSQPEDTEGFRADMRELIRRFPSGRLADDALFQLANDYLFQPDLDQALPNYRGLQSFPLPHDYQDSAYFLPALGLIARAREGDLEAAKQLLEAYVERYPEGVFRLRCLFWQGRIAEKKDDTSRARELFQQVIDQAPYDYYALRARMHLEEGSGASGKDLPGADSRTRRELSEAYRKSRVDTRLTGSSPYHRRLQEAESTGLYRQLLEVEKGLDKRLDDIALEQLDSRGLTPVAALLLASRQDALAAKDSDLTPDNWLRLAGMMGHEIQDWPVAIQMAHVRSNAPRQRLTELQKDARYLASSYPDPATLKTLPLRQPLARAAWSIDGSTALSQSLMYAVMRHESGFYPGAISSEGAMGLFQFMPYVFRSLDQQWGLLRDSSARSDVEYLLEPENSIRLWARAHFEYGFDGRNDFSLSLMNHQAGPGNVRSWSSYWKKLGPEDDIEYRLETARFNATRNFVRRTLRDIAIVEAAGFFEEGAGK